VRVPNGYDAQLLIAWGDPVTPGAPAWDHSATQGAEAQSQQFGMHTDGMHYFPFLESGTPSSNHGLLCANNEYTHESILYPDGLDELSGGLAGSAATIDKVPKSQAAHGVSIIEIRRNRTGEWQVVQNSAFARRITGNTRMKLSGPVAGHELVQTKLFDIRPGATVDTGFLTDAATPFGTLNNCAHGYTPWGTYLTCEENWNSYFGWKNAAHVQTALERRYGVTRDGSTVTVGSNPTTSVYKWHLLDDNLSTSTTPQRIAIFWITASFMWPNSVRNLEPYPEPIAARGFH